MTRGSLERIARGSLARRRARLLARASGRRVTAMRWLRRKLGINGEQRWPAHVSVGRRTYGLGPRNFARPTAAAPIAVGSFCSFGPDVLILGQADHPTGLVSTYPFRTLMLEPDAGNHDAVTRGPVRIGSVWAGLDYQLDGGGAAPAHAKIRLKFIPREGRATVSAWAVSH